MPPGAHDQSRIHHTASATFQYCQDEPEILACNLLPQMDAQWLEASHRNAPCPFRSLASVKRRCRWVADDDTVQLPRSLVLWPVEERKLSSILKNGVDDIRDTSAVLQRGAILRIVSVRGGSQQTWASVILEHILAATARAGRTSVGSAGNRTETWLLLPDTSRPEIYTSSNVANYERRNWLAQHPGEFYDAFIYLAKSGPTFDRLYSNGRRPCGNALMRDGIDNSFSLKIPDNQLAAVPTAMEVTHEVLRAVHPIRWKKLLIMQHPDPWQTWYGIFELLLSATKAQYRIIYLADPSEP